MAHKIYLPENLSEEELTHVALLDAYFETRSNLPGKAQPSGNEMKRDDKTTLDIVDDLMPMARIAPPLVIRYMFSHGYTATADIDGRLKWAIWREWI